MTKKSKPLIAVINTSTELVEALEMAMRQEGFRTVSTVVPKLKNGKMTLNKLFAQGKPEVIIYDIAIPYKENWEYLQHIKGQLKEVGDAHFILTTTNKKALEKLIKQESYAFEITGVIDKPFDLEYLVEAVKKAVHVVTEQRKLSQNKN